MNLLRNILFYILLAVSLSVYSQNKDKIITVSFSNIELSDAIQRIEKMSNYSFFYDSMIIDLTQKVSLNVVNVSVKQAIAEMLKNSSLDFEITNSQIAIFPIKSLKSTTPKSEKKRVIVGNVVDEKNAEIIGATVKINGTNTGTVTDIKGHFSLEVDNLDVLMISYLGYDSQLFDVAGKTNCTVKLLQSDRKLDEIIITAQALGQKNAIQKQINSNTLKNVISAEKLQQNPDANTIEAIGRLPGISVNRSAGEGAGFLLRGLDQSYSKILINGEPLAVGLNAISTYSLQGVEVYKSLTANLEGNAVAGSVDLTLRETPKGLHYSAMVQSGYNALNNDFGNYNFVGLISNRFFNDKLGVFFSVNADRVNRSTNLISVGYNTNYTTNLNDPFYISSLNFNLNERINYKQSAVLTLDYIASKSTILNFQSFLSASNFYSSSQSKNFSPEGNTALSLIHI